MKSKVVPNFFIGGRNDGLGERLKAIVNAMVLSSAYDKDFRFMWPMRTDMHQSHSIIPAEDFFSKDFIERWLVTGQFDKSGEHEFGQLGQFSYCGKATSAVLTHQHRLPDDVILRAQQQPSGGTFADYFNQIGFAPHIIDAIRLAFEIAVGPSFTAIHLRAGDIIEGRFRYEFDRFIRKAFPFTLASEVIAQENASGRKVIIFGQDQILCRLLAERYDALFAGQLAEDLRLDQNQAAVFEIVLMSKSDKIIAGNSGFSDLAGFLSGHPNINAWSILPPEIMVEVTQRLLDDPWSQEIPGLQRAYARWCCVFDNRLKMSPRWVAEQLEQALADDPGNGLYQLFRALALYQTDGPDAAEAWFKNCINQDRDAFLGKRRIGGLAHVLTMQPTPDRLLAEPYLLELARNPMPLKQPYTAFAIGFSLINNEDQRDLTISMLNTVLSHRGFLPEWLRGSASAILQRIL